jgi:hypothetical protein
MGKKIVMDNAVSSNIHYVILINNVSILDDFGIFLHLPIVSNVCYHFLTGGRKFKTVTSSEESDRYFV